MLALRAYPGEQTPSLCYQPSRGHYSGVDSPFPIFASVPVRVPAAGSSANPAMALAHLRDSESSTCRYKSFTSANELLGRGRQGTVLLAKDANGRTCAVKRIEVPVTVSRPIHEIIATLRCAAPPLEFSKSQTNRESPQRAVVEAEVRLWGRLQHPAIVQLHGVDCALTDCGTAVYKFYMEHMACGSLRSFAQRFYPEGRLPERDMKWFLRPILQALHHMHTERVVHLDVKAENILLAWDDEHMAKGIVARRPVAKLADFGCARALDQVRHNGDNTDSHTSNQSNGVSNTGLLGTPGFIAPEVVVNCYGPSDAYSTAADMWSFGCTILQLLHGVPPVSPNANPVSILYETAFCPERIYRFIPAESTGKPSDSLNLIELLSDEDEAVTISPLLRDVLRQCLEISPAKRATAAELLQHAFFQENEQKKDTPLRAMSPEICSLSNTTSTFGPIHEGLSEADEDSEENEYFVYTVSTKKKLFSLY